MESDSTVVGLTLLVIAERRNLLRLARDAIAAALAGKAAPTLTAPTPALLERRGAFVSLHRLGQLRGCVGTLTAERALHETVAHMALVAAFEDPRFAPLRPSELPQTEIEISRLTTPIAATPDEVVAGRDGVCVMRGDHRGVFLPQVAQSYGWDRTRLLEEVCRKALLPPDAWRDPRCQLLRFEAEVFSERGVEG